MREQIRQFIINNFLFGESEEGLGDDDSFLEKGILDSTGMLELVAFIEETYEINMEDEELIPENLDSINNLTAFIDRKQGKIQSVAN